MSTTRALAKSGMRYWVNTPEGGWELASNAPRYLYDCFRTMPKTITPHMCYEAFRIVGGGAALERPVDMLLVWISKHPTVIAHCDAALKSNRVPRSLAELLEKAYSAELLIARNHIDSCLQQQILI